MRALEGARFTVIAFGVMRCFHAYGVVLSVRKLVTFVKILYRLDG